MTEKFGTFQDSIYADGRDGKFPRMPFEFTDLESRAGDVLSPQVYDYVRGGAGDEFTQDENVAEMQRYGIVPRMMRDRSQRDMSVDFLGKRLQAPIFLCPVGANGVVYPKGDLETARAAASLGIAAMYSTLSESPLEEIAEARGDSLGIFQLYPSSDQTLTDNLVRRADEAGFDALAITVDTGVQGYKPRDLKNAFDPFVGGMGLANYMTDPRFIEIAGTDKPDPIHAGNLWISLFENPSFSFDDIARIRRMTDLPILVKGICHPDDAVEAQSVGVDVISCSNHGGRQANGGLPAISHLERIIAAVDLPVTFDSGIRNGVDVLRVLGLGAALAGIGRPYVYGLTLDGQHGVEHVIRSLLAEADLTMAVDGITSIDSLEIVDRGRTI